MRQSESVSSDVGLPGACSSALTAEAVFLQRGALSQHLAASHWHVVRAVWLLHPTWVQPFTTPGKGEKA